MLDLVIPFLLNVVVSVVAVAAGIAAYLYFRAAALRYRNQSARLPEATEWNDLHHKLLALRGEHAKAVRELEEAKPIVERRRAAEEWLQKHGEAYRRLVAELPQMQARESELAESIRKAHDKHTDLVRQLDTTQVSLDFKAKALGELEHRTADTVSQFESLAGKINQAKQEEAALQVQLAENRARLEECLNSIRHAEKRIDEVRQAAEQERHGLEQKLQEIRDKIDKDREEAGTLRTAVLENIQRESQLATRCQELSTRAATLEQQEARLKDQVEQLRNQESLCKLATAQAELKKNELENVQRELDELVRATRRDLDTESRDLEKIRAEHQRLTNELQEMKLHYSSLQQRIAESAKLVPAANVTDEDKSAELWSPVLPNLARSRSAVDVSEMDALQNAANYLRELGLHFPDRTLKAFHATLKVADISPLVVLAGISGTGKSLLPRRYSEAMGIHFLNLPVQPRWDSPQDMFGFYNYLENRYRSTELSRALVQMDPFAGEAGRGWRMPEGWLKDHSCADQVLIVLLDEMNLARVEYYFSEFLSRLETRRGLNVSKAEDRRKSEVVLEVGLSVKRNGSNGKDRAHAGGEETEPTMQVFVDRNVLFVGTMNEDESTQTLSDKVVDRANVIRFGKPKRLDQKVNGTAADRNARYLPFATWKSWHRTPDQLPADVGAAIERLNAAMTEIRRPFAYRTAQAIQSYVANYPDRDAYRDALADQVEFKILPRFRGIDLSENVNKRALSDVRRLVETELKDEKLAAAIEECEGHGLSDNQFAWHGLDRSSDE